MKFIRTILIAIALSFPSIGAFAGEKTVTLAVDNMTCITCPYMVKKSLTLVDGVTSAEISFRDKTAVVTFDDAQVNLAVLTAATTNAGYPSRMAKRGTAHE